MIILYFVLLSELEHFVLLSQYYRHLGSWSALKDFHKKTDTIATKICWGNDDRNNAKKNTNQPDYTD